MLKSTENRIELVTSPVNDKELEYGIEMNGRNRILSDFVASNYKVGTHSASWGHKGQTKGGPGASNFRNNEKKCFHSINAHSRFAIVALRGVLGPSC